MKRSSNLGRWAAPSLGGLAMVALIPAVGWAAGEGDATEASASFGFALDNMILFVAAVLVLFMQGGFAMVEAGLNSAKNTTNILFKNVMDLAVGVVLFFIIGYGLMFPGDASWKGIVGFGGSGINASPADNIHPQIFFLFQVAFAATAATIVSGAVAGRMKFSAYLVYSAVLTALVYPISGMWTWGGGWLTELGFADFAGSVIVHAVGGFAALAGAIVLGPRIGRFEGSRSVAMPGHNLAYATLGVVILWVGWYGFNPGSQLAFSTSDDVAAVALVAVNTTLAAAAGCLISMLVAWKLFGKPDLTMALNGALAGLVGITANCNDVTNIEALVIGGVAGGLVVAGIMLLDKLRIDDPVGAFPVHGLCGVWGGLATGIFGSASLSTQLIGTIVIIGWAFSSMLVLFLTLRAIGMLRVTAEEEQVGLDVSEHGMHAYPAALITETHGTPVIAPSGPRSEGRVAGPILADARS